MREPRNPMLWEQSLSTYKIFGSCSPATFEEKVKDFPELELQSSVAVFVDILRATSTLLAIAASECEGIRVDKKPKSGEYSFIPPFLPNEDWVYGGEYDGNPIKGRDSNGNLIDGVIDNSPLKAKPVVFRGKYLNFFSTNGAKAFDILAKSGFGQIFAMCLANVDRTAEAIQAIDPRYIWLVGGGVYGGAAIEDSVAAGLLIRRLIELGLASRGDLDDEAETMRIHTLYFQHESEFLEQEFLGRLRNAQVARLLTKLGHGKDVNAVINGEGMEDVWSAMSRITLRCLDMKTKLLVPEDDINPVTI